MRLTDITHPVYFALSPQAVMVTLRAHGLDISKYDLRFLPADATGQLDFVIQRVSYRKTRDEAFATLIGGVLQVPIRAGYHYLNSDTDWRAQADAFCGFVAPYDYHFFACDFEGTFNILSADFAYQAWQWIHYVQDKTGKPVVLYTSPYLYNDHMIKSQVKYGINWDTIPLWTAQWFLIPNPNGSPMIPNGRPSGWKLWQYTAKGNGPLYGVARPTTCDLNVFNGTVADMRSYFKIGDTPPPPNGGTMDDKYFRVTTTSIHVRSAPNISAPDTVAGGIKLNDIVHAVEMVTNGTVTWHKIDKIYRGGHLPVTLLSGENWSAEKSSTATWMVETANPEPVLANLPDHFIAYDASNSPVGRYNKQ
jgi:GH25 family lysozyme M1 (1,4-beta-N-acetylmuramidase)